MDRFKTDFKDEIPIGELRLYDMIDQNGGYIGKGVKLVRSNGNTQDGDKFGAKEVNAIHNFLNDLLNGNETVAHATEADEVSWDGVLDKPSSFPPTTHKHTKSQITDFPSALKNPKALTFAGGATGSYDGSTAKTITIPTLTGITGIKLFSVTVKPNNVNYFDVARASNEYIVPLHLSISSVWIEGIQYGSASVRVILNPATSSSITFTYMIVYV